MYTYKDFMEWANSKFKKRTAPSPPVNDKGTEIPLPNGRVSVPEGENDLLSFLKNGMIDKDFVKSSFRPEVIKIIRDLYKVNPDVGIAVQDMYKLSNTDHIINFPFNTEKEAREMRTHLAMVSKDWSNNLAGTFGLANKMFIQAMISGSVSIEAVPKTDLSGISTVVFVDPDTIVFRRGNDAKYYPYQKKNKRGNVITPLDNLVKLNLNTYKYVGIMSDTDEPYGIPPFMSALDSLKTQADMQINIKQIMEMMGLLGFLEVKVDKPLQREGESTKNYERRLINFLTDTRKTVKKTLKDGVLAGYIDDHEFKMNSTTKDLGNVDKPWNQNQQRVANGLGVAGSIIGVDSSTKTEGGTSILFSKLLSQLQNGQEIVANVFEFIYDLELRLAGFSNNKGASVTFYPSTVTDDIKIQQAGEYKIRNVIAKRDAGIISQDAAAFELGYQKPFSKEPILIPGSDVDKAKKEQDREADKDKSDRKTRDKNNPVPKRKDSDTKER